MPQNGIRMDGIAALVRGISECKGLRYLDLQDNAFGELGSTTISQLLREWPELHTLNLSDCVLAEEGEMSPVVEILSNGSNPKLELLALQNNNFEGPSFALLAEAIELHFPVLKRLELQWNEIEEDDALADGTGTQLENGHAIPLEDIERGENGHANGNSRPRSRSTSRTRAAKKGRNETFIDGARYFFSLLLGPVFVQAFALTFLGEGGDRSQIATIALGAAHVRVF